MITIKEVAELARVSPSTVSNVLQGRVHKMKSDTLERVQGIIKQYDYVANMSGRTLGKYGSKIIAVVMNYARRECLNAVQHPFLSEILGALEHEIRSAGFFMMLYISANAEESLRMAASWNVEGLVATGCNAENCRKFIRGAERIGVPIVFIDAYDEGADLFNVGLEDRKGGFMMTEYLVRQGHTRIAFLADTPVLIGVDYERLQGHKAALERYGLGFLEEDYVCISHKPEEQERLLTRFAAERLHEYSALFFASDYLAAHSMNFFHDRGIQVPEDVSVCGFDDNIFALEARPRLTTVKQDVAQKAFFALNLLVSLIKKERVQEQQVILPVSLTIRDSVRSLRSRRLF
ncbi:MAG: LacI family transcriptional regulator [Spirochaetaceae bacterium]|jgi:LacI family transcriptional regulator|nr:LacI family transcriptional regulator [Spirochaetaceae bacterium]